MTERSLKSRKSKPAAVVQELLKDGVGKVYHLRGTKVAIGRNLSAEIPVPSTRASRNHAFFESTKQGWAIIDNNIFVYSTSCQGMHAMSAVQKTESIPSSVNFTCSRYSELKNPDALAIHVKKHQLGYCHLVGIQSVNGVYVNGQRLKPMKPTYLKNGCEISLGPPSASEIKYKFRFVSPHKGNLRSSENEKLHEQVGRQSAEKPVPGSSRSACSAEGEPTHTECRTPRKRQACTDEFSRSPSSSPSLKRKCSEANESSLKERLAAIDNRLKFSEEINRRVKQVLNQSEEKLNQESLSGSDESQSLISNENHSTNKEVSFENSSLVAASKNAASKAGTSHGGSKSGKKNSKSRTSTRNSQLNTSSEHSSKEKELSELRTKVAMLEKQLKEQEERKVELQQKSVETGSPSTKPVRQKTKEVKQKAAENEETEEEKAFKSSDAEAVAFQESVKEEVANQFGKLMEAEMTCAICTELFVKATTLECAHTFCYKCLTTWKKTKKECPICRATITGETRSLVIDNFIDKMVEKLSPEYQERRKQVVKERTIPEKKRKTKKKRSSAQASTSRGRRSHVPYQEIVFDVEDDDDDDDDMSFVPSFAAAFFSEFSDVTDEDESPVESYVYYGGYGRCYNCGRTGHWANGCPES